VETSASTKEESNMINQSIEGYPQVMGKATNKWWSQSLQ